MNSAILKNIFREFAPRLAGLTASGGGLYGLAKWYDASNEKNLQSPNSPNSQPRSRIMQAIVDANPNRNKLDARTDQKKSTTYEEPVSQNDFAYGRSMAANTLAQQQEEMERAKRYQAEMERAKRYLAAKDQDLRYQDEMAQAAIDLAKKEQSTREREARAQAAWEREAKEQAEWNQVANEHAERRRDAIEQTEREDAERRQAAMERAEKLIKNTPASPNVIPNNPTNTNVPHTSQQPGTAAPTPNASVDNKTSNNQNGSNSIAALLNNNPGYLTPTAIGQTLIAALLGRLLGGKTGMGLGAIMGLLASPLTASWLAKNNYLSNIAKPFSETEKGWFSNSK